MERSIIRTVLFNFFLQFFIILIFAYIGNVGIISVLVYCLALFILHVILALFLFKFKNDFFNLSTNQPLQKINPANRITLLRISSLVTIAFLLQHRDLSQVKVILPIILALTFLTDTFDGQIARRRKQVTRMGQMLDSISDYSLLALISIVYFQNNILPVWFFYLVLFRLSLQALGMLIFILLKKPLETKSTWGGKITIATTMTLYLLELLRLYIHPCFDSIFTILEGASGIIILTLSFEKVRLFFRQGKKIYIQKEI